MSESHSGNTIIEIENAVERAEQAAKREQVRLFVSSCIEKAREATDALAPEKWPPTLTQIQKHKLCFAHLGFVDAVSKMRRTLGTL